MKIDNTMCYWLLSGFFSFGLGSLLLYIGFSLNAWGEKNLDYCCYHMCGRTVNVFADCYPGVVSGLIFVIGLLLWMFSLYCFILYFSERAKLRM